ncbi:MAG: glucuronyl hydrolase [Chitinophagia bacterium]|nr:glucuronyl hydrolase [Chitinophagia bacterium]
MKTKWYTIFTAIGVCAAIVTQAQIKQAKPIDLTTLIDSALQRAVRQYQFLGTQLPDGVLPKTYYWGTKKFETSKTNWWTSGFYPGTLHYLFDYSKNESLQNEALRVEKFLQKEQYNKGTHDLGFMMYNSFGHALQQQKSKEYEDILMNSAKSLSSRFRKSTGTIKSWDHGKWQFPVIIDNMMNLELLFWATRYSNDSSFYKIAVTHANTTMANHYRKDFSSYHVIDYDTLTGAVRAKNTHQGYSDASAWARGQAWGLYGYVSTYRYTKNKVYLNQANQIAKFMIHHPRLPEDGIPWWDYDSPDIPATYRDASAGAILASALLELTQYNTEPLKKEYRQMAEKIIRSLASPTYTANISENGGFILKHSTGHLPGNSEVDVPLTYADYYYVEALIRLRAMVNNK